MFRHRTANIAAVAAFALGTSGSVAAAPFEGAGGATLESGSVSARARASQEARKAALEAAIEAASFEVSVRPDQLRQVRVEWANWTGAYRVVAVDRTPTQVLARIEVDVDVARLKKILADRPTPAGDAKFSWDGLSTSGCSAATTPTQIHAALAAAGLVRSPQGAASHGPEGGGGRTLRVALSCSDTGDVAFTYLRGAKARVAVMIDGARASQVVGVGLGATPREAITMAVKEAVDGLKVTLARRGSSGVRVVLKGAWRATEAEGLARRIKDAMRGADDVRVFEISPAGDIVLAVETSATLEGAYKAIKELEYIRTKGWELQVNEEGGVDVYASEATAE